MTIEIKVPEIGESITEVQVGVWLVEVGSYVAADEPVVEIESEKASVELPAPQGGVLARILVPTGENAAVGQVIGELEEAAGEATVAEPSIAEPPATAPADAAPVVMPAARRVAEQSGVDASAIPGSGPGGRVLKEDVLKAADARPAPAAAPAPAAPTAQTSPGGSRAERVVRMSPLRRTIARRLVESQHTAALLTTFNEIDMSEVIAIRKRLGGEFLDRHEIKLGFMSFFVAAAVAALQKFPELNASIVGEEIVYHEYYDIGIAIGGGKGLVVPVIRNAETLGFADIERAIADYGQRAQAGKIELSELEGGTFSISNGGVYGSLMSTPIVNPPQSAILGLHAIQERPVVRDGEVVIRKMMYVALTYDHRIVDGREAVTFLRTIKEGMEQPTRLLLEI